jgi:hypothetical protein
MKIIISVIFVILLLTTSVLGQSRGPILFPTSKPCPDHTTLKDVPCTGSGAAIISSQELDKVSTANYPFHITTDTTLTWFGDRWISITGDISFNSQPGKLCNYCNKQRGPGHFISFKDGEDMEYETCLGQLIDALVKVTNGTLKTHIRNGSKKGDGNARKEWPQR